jgi:hypothetical protein
MSDDILDKVAAAAAALPVGSSQTEIEAAATLAKSIAEAQKPAPMQQIRRGRFIWRA